MEIKSTEFFRNMKTLPPVGSEEFKQLIDWETEKILGGVTVNGVYFSGWLYWHLNHWWIRIDALDEFGNDIRVEQRPELRDNEWIRAEYFENCKVERKGYIEIGGRQGGKSEFEASYTGMNATMFKNTQNVIVCGNDNDLSLLKDKVDFGLRKVWEGLYIPRLDKTWKSNQVKLGYKTPDGDDQIWSYLVIRNAKDGHNTEVAAGTTAKSFVMDEIGKYAFGSAFKAAEPAFKGKFGWRAVPILVGTGGAFENGKDAEGFFYNPDANNFLGIPDEKTNKKTGLFLSGLYRQDCKEEITLTEWLKRENKLTTTDTSELDKIKIFAANKQLAEQKINQEREAAKQNTDKTLYLKQKMYYPLTVDECFLSVSQNIYDIESAKIQKARVLQFPKASWNVNLFLNEQGKVDWQNSEKLPIFNFPHKPSDNTDAPVVILEHPIDNPPYSLYIAGVDPYRQGKAKYSDSLGAVYIYKRMHSISGEEYQDMLVAYYVARPDKKEVWENQARLLCKYYNARVLCENDEISFIEYMKAKGDAHMLVKMAEVSWLKEAVAQTTVSREYGIHRSSEKIRDYLSSSLKKYLESPVYLEKDEDGNIVREILGVSKVFDPMLLEEIINFNEDGNFDRIVAVSLAIAQANILDPIVGKVTIDEKSLNIYKPKKQTALFKPRKSSFRRTNLFRK